MRRSTTSLPPARCGLPGREPHDERGPEQLLVHLRARPDLPPSGAGAGYSATWPLGLRHPAAALPTPLLRRALTSLPPVRPDLPPSNTSNWHPDLPPLPCVAAGSPHPCAALGGQGDGVPSCRENEEEGVSIYDTWGLLVREGSVPKSRTCLTKRAFKLR
jgi:hypothetical protein